MLAWLSLVPSFVKAVWSIAGIAIEIFKFLREAYDRSQRAEVAKEIKAALKESRETKDNTRLINVFNPDTEPFPRKSDESKS